MSLLRSLLKPSLRKIPLLRAEASRSKPLFNLEKIRKWTSVLNSKATSTDSKALCAQLSSLVQYFTKPSTIQTQDIDWNTWKESIVTPEIVDNLKEKYEKLSSEEYDVETIVNGVVDANSADVENLNNELFFHSAVWLNHFSEQQAFLLNLEEMGNGGDYLMHELYDKYDGLEADLEELTETHNYLPGSKDDINARGFYQAEFSWGKKVISFYRHPSDDFKGARATKNILGR